ETLTAASARTEHDAGGDPAIPHERDPHRSGPLRVLDENEVPDHVPAACMHGSLAGLRRSAHGDLVRLPQERLELRAAALVLDPGHGSQPCLGPWIGPRARREVGPHPFAQVPGLPDVEEPTLPVEEAVDAGFLGEGIEITTQRPARFVESWVR